MRLQHVFYIFSLFELSFCQGCTNEWHLVQTKDGPVCWALLSVPDFSTNYSSSLNLCSSANGKGVTVQNAAEKAMMASLASLVDKSSLTCYRASQSSLEGKWKTFDYETPPEYIRKVNENGKVKLAKGLEKGDRITIGFSLKVGQNAHFRIGGSNDFSLDIIFDDKTKMIHYKHKGMINPEIEQIKTEVIQKGIFTSEYIGHLIFDFLDKQISFLGYKFNLPSQYTYIGKDDLFLENIIVSSIEYSKVCPGMDYYEFQNNRVPVTNTPNVIKEKKHITIPRRGFHSSNISVSLYDFHKENSNFWHFTVDFRGKQWRKLQIAFHNSNTQQDIVVIELFKSSGVVIGKKADGTIDKRFFDWGNFENEFWNLRVDLNLAVSTGIKVVPILSKQSGPVHPLGTELVVAHQKIDEIKFFSDSVVFYDFQMMPLSEVITTTCNFRPDNITETGEMVPFRSKCFEERNVLCQKNSESITEIFVPPEEELEKKVWSEEIETTSMISTTVEIKKEKIQIEHLEGFQLCIVILTGLSTSLIATALILHFVTSG